MISRVQGTSVQPDRLMSAKSTQVAQAGPETPSLSSEARPADARSVGRRSTSARGRQAPTTGQAFTMLLAATAPLAHALRPMGGAAVHLPTPFAEAPGHIRLPSASAQAAVDSALLPAPTYNRRLESLPVAGGVFRVRASIVDEVSEALAYLAASPRYRSAIAELAKAPGRPLEIHLENDPMIESLSNRHVRIASAPGTSEYDPFSHRIFWNPAQAVHEYITGITGDLECAKGTPAATLGHELLHAAEQLRNPARSMARSAIVDPVFGSAEERAVAQLTSKANAEIGEPPMMNHQCDFVDGSRGVSRPNPDACRIPVHTEDELIGKAMGRNGVAKEQIVAAKDAQRLLQQHINPVATRSNREFSAIVQKARDLFVEAHGIVANGGSYGDIRAQVNAHLKKALQFTQSFPRPANAGGTAREA